MMIEDNELRELYQRSGEERLQKLEAGLLRLEEQPDDRVTVELLLREMHSLWGDSRAIGLEEIAHRVEAIETALKDILRQESHFSPRLAADLYEQMNAIAYLIYKATTGEPGQVDVPAIAPGNFSGIADAPALASLFADAELRDIYAITSSSCLHALELGLMRLADQPEPVILEELRRHIHSLKGDSRAVGLETVALLAERFEDGLKRLPAEAFTAATIDTLFIGLDAIARLVQEAMTAQPSGVDTNSVLELLSSVSDVPVLNVPVSDVPVLNVPVSDVPVFDVPVFDVLASDVPLLNDRFAVSPELPALSPAAELSIAPIIEDPELLVVFRATTEERLQKLEGGLSKLEGQPNDTAVLAELLREAHSLKGDSRSAGIKPIEELIHQLETVFERIQRREIEFTAAISDRLYVGLDAMGQLLETTATGQPSRVDVGQILEDLSDLTEGESVAALAPVIPEVVESDALPALPLGESYRIDAIRVPTQDLDVLMNQTEELTITRIQVAQALTQAEQLANLWEEWRDSKKQARAAEGAAISSSYEEQFESLISALRSTTQDSSKRLDIVAESLREKVYDLRLLPLSTIFQRFPRIVRDLTRQQSKLVELIIEGGETTADKRILEGIKDALTHLIRNAIDHGIETPEEREQQGKPAIARIWLRGYQSAMGVVIEVADDGRGLDLEQIKQTAIRRRLYSAEALETMSPSQIHALIFAPGFSTRTFITELSGRGVGLDVVQTQVERLNGTIQINSTPQQGCTFRLNLKTSLTSINVVITEVQGIAYALPFEFLQTTLMVSSKQIIRTEAQDTLVWHDQTIPVVNLFDVLELSKSPGYPFAAKAVQQSDRRPCLIFQIGEERVGFLVDRLRNTQEVVLKPQSRLLKRVRNVLGGTTLASGEVCMILNPADLIKSLQQPLQQPIASEAQREVTPQRKRTILLVEDSKPVQIQERRLFEGAGYEVVVANDGLEGYDILRSRRFDAVVSDVEMPHLDGLSLTAKIRQHPKYKELPIILVTTLSSDEDRQRGAEAGASAYIAKGKFNQEVLLETIARLI